MTIAADASGEGGYDLFISYRSEKSAAHAVAIRDALYVLGKRHPEQRQMRIFLDRISLRTGGLAENIANGVRNSRHLLVLIDETTVRSEWVSKEIRDWLDAGGAQERLFLMRTSTAVDLSWDDDADTFRYPEVLPQPLRNAFSFQQKTIDFTVPPRRVNEVELIGLYSSVMAADPEAMGEDERRHLQKQRRRNRIFTGILAGFLVVSLAAGAIAVVNFLRADESARQARSDALGAEGLLTLPVAPDRAIDQAVEASRLGSGTSVRSVLLATASDTRRLQGTFSLSRDGGARSLAGVSLSPGSTTLTAWGPVEDGGSVVVSWETTNRDVVQRFPVAEDTITSMVEVPGIAYLACTPQRALRIDWRTHQTVVLHPAATACTTDAYLGGGVAQVTTAQGTRTLVGATIDGQAIEATGVLLPGSRERVWRLIENDGVITGVLTPKGVVELERADRGRLMSADSVTFVTVRRNGKYRMFSVAGTTLRQTTPKIPSDVTAAVGWEDYRGRQVLVWVLANGTVGWTGGSDTLTMGGRSPDQGTRTDQPTAAPPRLARFESDSALLSIGNRFFEVSEQDGRLAAEPLAVRRTAIPEASKRETTTCGPYAPVIVDEKSYVTATGQLVERGAVLRNCHAVEAGPPVRIDGRVVAESAFANLRLTDVGKDGQLALAREDGVISYFSASDDESVPWSIDPSLQSLMAPNGTVVLKPGPPPSLVSDAGTVEMGLGASGHWSLPSPDGKGGVLVDGKRRWLAIDGEIPVMLSAECTNQAFEPSTDFRSSLDAARAPQLIGHTARGRIDCLTGAALPAAPAVLAYVVGDRSVIVSRDDGRVAVTTWRTGDTTPTVRELPGIHPKATIAAVGPSGDRVLVGGSDSPELLEFAWDGAEFRPAQRYAMTVGVPSTFAYSPDESLVMTARIDGMFDVFDSATGRLLASHTTPIDSDTYTGLVIVEREGFLLAFLRHAGDGGGGALIRIPVGIPQLQDLLCRVHHSTQC